MPKKKKKAEYTIEKKRSGRYSVRGKDGKYINGDAKADILAKDGKIKKTTPKPKAEEKTEE